MPSTERNKKSPPPPPATVEPAGPDGPALPPATVPGHFIRRRSDRAFLGSLLVLAALGFLTLCYFAASVFITIISSILIAFALEPLVQILCDKMRLRRNGSSVIVVFLAMGALYAILYLAYASARQLFVDLPSLLERLREAPFVDRVAAAITRWTELFQEAGRTIAPPVSAPQAPAKEAAVIVRDSPAWAETVFRGLGSLTTVLFSLSFIPFLVYFLLAEKESLVRRTRELFREEHRDTMRVTISDIERMLQRFLAGYAIVAAILCIVSAVVFLLVGLPYWLVLGIVSGIVSTIPYLGLVLALLPPLVVGMISFESGTPVAIIVTCVSAFHLVAINFLMPKLVGKEVRLNPVASTVSIMFFGWLWGGMGLILGIPIVAVAKVVLENMEPTRKVGLWLGD